MDAVFVIGLLIMALVTSVLKPYFIIAGILLGLVATRKIHLVVFAAIIVASFIILLELGVHVDFGYSKPTPRAFSVPGAIFLFIGAYVWTWAGYPWGYLIPPIERARIRASAAQNQNTDQAN